MPEKISCNLCGSKKADKFFESHDHLLDMPGTYRFVRCQMCGLIYVSPRPTWAERAAHYAPTYRGYHRLETENSRLQRRLIEYGCHKRTKVVTNHIRSGRLLDIGCSGGDFLQHLRKQPGWQVFGLERVPDLVQVARRIYRLDVSVGDVLHLGFASATFDVVTLWTVLEHISDPLQGLRECARVLRRGGLLIVRTVNVDSWGARLFGPDWVGYDAPRILFAFNVSTLGRILDTAGFSVQGIGCYFHDFYPFLWSWRNFCRSRIHTPWLSRRLDRISRTWLVRLLSFPFFFAQTHLGKNSFVTATARKC